MTQYEKSAIRGYVHMGVPVEQIVEMTGFLKWQIQKIIDELKKELEDGKNGGTDRI